MTDHLKMLSSSEPGCIVLLIDQSASMSDRFGGTSSGRRDVECAKAVNRVLRETAICCSSGKEIKDRCEIGIIGYGAKVGSAFCGTLAGKELVKISEVANYPIRIDSIKQKVNDGNGGLVEIDAKSPVWIEPVSSNGTPMAEAFNLAITWISNWVNSHHTSFPPVVINITDGEPNDSNLVKTAAKKLSDIQTDDGKLVLLNAHISGGNAKQILLPSSENELPDEYAKFLFNISSILPDSMRRQAEAVGFSTNNISRGFIYNADAESLIRLLQFGSNPGGLR